MKKLSVLKIAAIIHLFFTVLWTLVYFDEINDGKGWGLLLSVGLVAIGLAALLVSWLVGLVCRKIRNEQPKKLQNTVEAVLLVAFILFVALYY